RRAAQARRTLPARAHHAHPAPARGGGGRALGPGLPRTRDRRWLCERPRAACGPRPADASGCRDAPRRLGRGEDRAPAARTRGAGGRGGGGAASHAVGSDLPRPTLAREPRLTVAKCALGTASDGGAWQRAGWAVRDGLRGGAVRAPRRAGRPARDASARAFWRVRTGERGRSAKPRRDLDAGSAHSGSAHPTRGLSRWPARPGGGSPGGAASVGSRSPAHIRLAGRPCRERGAQALILEAGKLASTAWVSIRAQILDRGR